MPPEEQEIWALKASTLPVYKFEKELQKARRGREDF